MANDNSDVEVRFGGDAGEAIEETRKLADTVKTALGSLNSDMGASSVAAYAFGEVIGNVMMNVANKIGDMVKHAVVAYGELGGAVEAAQRRIGGSAEYVSGMKVALESVGLSMQQFQNTSQRLGQILIANGERIKEAGIEYLDMNGKLLDSSTIIQNISEHLEKFTAGAARNTEGARLLGRSYRELADYVELTKERIAEAKQVAEEFGLVMTDKDLAATNELQRQTNLLSSAIEGFFVLVGKALTPALTALAISMRDGASPAFLIFKGVVVGVMAVLEGLVWGIHLLWEVLGTLTDTIHLAASALEALGYAMTFQFAKAAEVGKKAWEDYSASVAARAASILSHASNVKARMDALVSAPAAGNAPEGSGEDPAKHKGGDPVGQAKAAANLALIKQSLSEELSALSDAHKNMLGETEEYYDKKLSITLRGLNAEKEKLAADLKAIEAEHQAGETKERAAQIEAKAIGLRGQSAVLDRKIADAVVTNEREKTEAVQQETIKRVDAEERAKGRVAAIEQAMGRDRLANLRALGELSASEELTSIAGLNTQKYELDRASLSNRLAVQQQGTAKYREIQEQILALDKQRERDVLKSEQDITLAKQNELIKRRMQEIEAAAGVGAALLSVRAAETQAAAQLGHITAETELATMQNLANAKHAIEVQVLEDKRALYAQGTDEYRRYTDQIEVLEVRHKAEVVRIQARAQALSQKNFDQMLAAQERSFASTLSELLQGTMTWQKALGTLYKQLTKTFADFVANMITDWVKGEITKTGLSKAWSTIRKAVFGEEAEAEVSSKAVATEATSTLSTTSASTTISSKATEATAVVAANAAEAGSGAAASVSSIPIVGWAMAAGVFAAVLAMVLGAQSNIKSARGGFDIPAGLNPVTQLHEEEMVLPKEQADAVREMADQGFGGGRGRNQAGGVHMHVHTQSTREFRDFLRQNSGSLRPGIEKLARQNFQSFRRS